MTSPADSLQALAPPHSIEAEQSVLGAILLADRTLYAIAIDEGLKPEHFYREQHGKVYRAMLALYAESREIDVLTVTEHLRHMGALDDVGGAAMVDALAGAAPAAGNVREYARIVRNNARLRDLLRAAQQIQANVLNRQGTVAEIIDAAERDIFAVSTSSSASAPVHIEDITLRELALIDRLARGAEPPGLLSGLRGWDQAVGRLKPGRMIVLAARPGMGKTLMIGQVSRAIARSAHVLFFSLEMADGELAQRLLASEAGIPVKRFEEGEITERDLPKLIDAGKRVSTANLWIEDGRAITPFGIRAKSREHAKRHGLDLIVIDYLQMITPNRPTDNRTQDVSTISRELTQLAGELGVALVVVSSLNREVEHRNDKRPLLSDLRESGQIESDASIVAMLYRDDYYNPDSDAAGETEILVRKRRHGSGPARTTLRFNASRELFYDPDPGDF